MRNRIEDLGRILVLVEQILDKDVFEDYNRYSSDEAAEEVLKEDDEGRMEMLIELFGSIYQIKYALEEVWEIARGEDVLNQNDCHDDYQNDRESISLPEPVSECHWENEKGERVD